MKTTHKNPLRAAALAAILACSAGAQAATEVAGFELYGYTRGGAQFSSSGTPRGGYTLGGDAQKFRLGNEGDHGIEFGIGRSFDLGEGMKWGARFMQTVWNGESGTAEAYASFSGVDFAPEVEFWAGQRRLRLQDVHIVDRFFADYGDNFGAGFTGLKIGPAKLGVGVFSSASIGNRNSTPNDARRFNIDLSELPVNPGGTLRVTATAVSGDFRQGQDGGGLSLVHNQADFLLAGLKHSLFVQAAGGHAGLNGQFFNLDDAAGTASPGAKSWRIVDSLNWQRGAFGGQTIAAYQRSQVSGGANDGQETRDTSLGGRVSYALGRNLKLLAEAGTTRREIEGQATQQLSKLTVAPALSLGPEFWSRPELRLYATRVTWNDAAAAANASSFGAGGRTSSTLFGVQIEAWW